MKVTYDEGRRTYENDYVFLDMWLDADMNESHPVLLFSSGIRARMPYLNGHAIDFRGRNREDVLRFFRELKQIVDRVLDDAEVMG